MFEGEGGPVIEHRCMFANYAKPQHDTSACYANVTQFLYL